MYLLSMVHVFSPPGFDKDEDEEAYNAQIIIRQSAFYGPFQESFAEIATPHTMEQLQAVEQVIEENRGRTPYSNGLAMLFGKEDIDFLHDIMKPDPRDRWSARRLLQHPWFHSNCT